MEDDKLTVTEILNGLLRKEYIDHRAQLFQLLVNLFADENESDSQQLIVKSSNSLTANNNNEESNLENEKDSNSSSTRPLQVNKETYRQLLRILLEFTDEKKFSHEVINLSLCVLVNATIKQEYIEYFLEFISTPDSGNPVSVKFHSVIDQYLSYNPQFEADDLISSPDFRWEELDQYQQVGNILANLCQQETGRKLILRTSTGYMLKLPSQVRSRNSVRRRGAVACIRSCLFDQDYHWWMLNEVKVLTPLLIPLVVPTPFNEKDKEGMDPTIWLQAENPDKKCEPDFEIMKLMVDCLILLCQRRGIREELRKRKVYPIMRNLDLKVEDENVTASIYEVVNFLIADEDPSTPIDHDDSKTPI